jgi:4-amino-4-deoxy-L-arabinose transferase-like glycosyltransferase
MSSTRLTLLVIFLLALGVRVAYLESDPRPLFGSWLQGGMAHNIVDDGHWFQINTNAYAMNAIRSHLPHLVEPADVNLEYADAHPHWEPQVAEPVGESVVLAGLWEITGSERFLPEEILRIVLDALTALLVYRIALQLFARHHAAALGALFYAVYPPIAWQTISPYVDFWAIDLTIAVLAMQLQASRSPHRWRWLVACGLLAGLATYFRPAVLVLSAILALILNIPAGWRSALARALVTTAVALVLTIPWTIRNYDVFHAFVPFRSGLGLTMWEGFADSPNSFGGKFDISSTIAMVHRERPQLAVESYAWDSYVKHKAIELAEQRPLFYLRLVAHRAAEATVLGYSPSWMHRTTVSPFTYKGGLLAFAAQRPFNLLEAALEPVAFLVAMLSFGFTWRRWRREHVVLMAVVLTTIIPYVALHVEHRYLMPASFAYLIWSALGIDLLVEELARRRQARRYRVFPNPGTVAPA